MKSKPYVGITGFTEKDQIKTLLNKSIEYGFGENASHNFLAGILVSYNTLNGSDGTRRYPKIDRIPGLLMQGKGENFAIHYYSGHKETLSRQINQLFRDIYKLGLCNNLQLNISWPPVAQIEKIKNEFPDLNLIFQLDKDVINLGSEDVVKKIKKYKDCLNYVLIDPSAGKGFDYDLPGMDNLMAFYLDLRNSLQDIGRGFAGRFNHENVRSRLRELIDVTGTKDFCIDAESGLRTRLSDKFQDDFLDITKAEPYLQDASEVLL